MVFVLGFLLLLLIGTASYSLTRNFSIPALLSQIAGFTGLAVAFVKALSSSNLRVYFWFQRIRIWWFSDSVMVTSDGTVVLQDLYKSIAEEVGLVLQVKRLLLDGTYKEEEVKAGRKR